MAALIRTKFHLARALLYTAPMNNDYRDDDDAPRPVTLAEFRKDVDWIAAVKASRKEVDPVPGFTGPTAWRVRDAVELVASFINNDPVPEVTCRAVLRLKDGRFVFLAADCDMTFGWSPPGGGGRSWVAGSLDALVRLAINPEDQERLGLTAR